MLCYGHCADIFLTHLQASSEVFPANHLTRTDNHPEQPKTESTNIIKATKLIK